MINLTDNSDFPSADVGLITKIKIAPNTAMTIICIVFLAGKTHSCR